MTSNETKKIIESIKETVIAVLREDIKKMIDSAVNIQIDGINKRLDTLQRTMDIWKSDLDVDRETLQGLRVNTGNMKTQLEELQGVVNSLPKKVEHSVEQSVGEAVADAIPGAVSDAFDVSGKNVNIVEKPRPWYLFWRR